MKLVFDLKKNVSLVLWYMVTISLTNDAELMGFFADENQEKELVTFIADNDKGFCFRKK